MQFRSFIEGVLDRETTDIARTIIHNIKQKEEVVRNLRPGHHLQLIGLKSPQDRGVVQRAARNANMRVADWAEMSVPPGSPNLLIYVGNGEPTHNGFMDRTNNILFGRLNVPKVGEQLDYHRALPMIKAVLRHELEHSQQPDNQPFARAADYPWQPVSNKAPSDVSFDDPASVTRYLTHPSEIEAWVAGIYKYAKTAKIPFNQAMDVQLKRMTDSMARAEVPAEQISRTMELVKAEWLKYQQHRFPAAKFA